MKKSSVLMCVFILFLALITTASAQSQEGCEDHPIVRTDVQKTLLLQKYAPLVWLHSEEAFFPAQVELLFENTLQKELKNNWWLFTKDKLPSPSYDHFPWFYGSYDEQDKRFVPVRAPIYAFWVQNPRLDYVDLVYFTFYTYNRGKKIDIKVDSGYFGNHVADWEHCTVRLKMINGELKPYKIYLSQHGSGFTADWEDYNFTDDGHPVVYSAKGSHSIWEKPGKHHYKKFKIPVAGTFHLVDLTDTGTPWETWKWMESYDYFRRKGLGTVMGGNASDKVKTYWEDGNGYPIFMGLNVLAPGKGAVVPGSKPIYRWGNMHDGCDISWLPGSHLILDKGGDCALTMGPEGPQFKWGAWDPLQLK